ncbi:MAG: hemoglobin/transferrin/lactoferrin receptor protein [Lentimonas sp.]|jgi:hemoglobin/transferrin/lactoferrin receptor protein
MKKTQNSRVLSACTIATFFAGSICAQDANTPKVKLEELTLKGTETSKVEYTAVNSVSQEFIDVKQPDDMGRLFENSLAVDVNGGKAQAQQIFINNIESSLANVTIDGAPQANLYHHASAVLIEPELLKSVEVLAGAGSALDGAGALAGAIRFETVNAYDLLNEGETFGGLSKLTGYHNGDGYKMSQSAYGEFAEGWGVLVSGSYADRGDFEDGDGNTIENSDYQRTSGLAKLTGILDESQTVEFSYEYIDEEFNSYDRININNDVLGGTGRPLGPLQQVTTERNTATVSYDVNPEDLEWLNLENSLYYTKQEFERTETNAGTEVESIGFDIRNTSDFKIVSVTYGLDYREDEAEVYGDPYGVSGTENTDIFGLYSQATVPVTEYAKVSFGARYDDYDYEDLTGQDFQSDKISPNGRITFFPIEHLALTASYAEAYRGVSTREVIFAGASPYPADTDGEEAETWKLEFDYDNGFIFANGSYFKQKIDNYLYPTGSGSLGDIENDGYEVKIGACKNGFHGSLGVSYSEPEVNGYDYKDDYGIVVAGRRWLGDFGYVSTNPDGSFFWRAGWLVEYRESVDEEPLGSFPAVAEKDSYVLHNFNFSFAPPAIENLTLALNVDNVFDKEYQDHTIFTAYGLNSAGRSIRLSASYEF